ncbi:MAG: molybdopterin-guanine dinucleotide biosynthesis protein B [Thermoplasmatota archaeon]
MTSIPVIGLYGESDSGKTTLVVKIIRYFKKQGLQIATIKQTNKDVLLDTVGKDTFKHRESGAVCTTLYSANNTDIMINKKINITELIDIISKMELFDFLIIEGSSDPQIPKIRIGTIKQRANTILDYMGDFNQVVDTINHIIKTKEKYDVLTIKVNGNNIHLSEFPTEIIQNSLLGMISSLKGVNTIDTVEIFIKKYKKKSDA